MIPRKKKICKSCDTLQFIFSGGLCKYCSMRKKEKTKKKSRAAVYHTNKKIDTADRLLSQLIKKLYAYSDNKIKCYTCDVIKHVNQIEAGHYISRGNLTTRWLIENVKPQCIECNQSKCGNLDTYKKRLEYDFPGLTEKLETLGRATIDKNTFDADEIIKNIRSILKLLED